MSCCWLAVALLWELLHVHATKGKYSTPDGKCAVLEGNMTPLKRQITAQKIDFGITVCLICTIVNQVGSILR